MRMEDLVRMQHDDEPEETTDGKVDCSTCQGTGLPTSGPIDQGRCWDCHGRGWHRAEDDDYGEERWDD